MEKRYTHYNNDGYITGVTKVKEDSEDSFLSEVLCLLVTGAIALFGLCKVYQILEPWLK